MQKNWLVINLNKKYFLKVGNKAFRCQIGKGGIKNAARKVEGDKSTPSGKWPLKSIYYRPDKINLPKLIFNSFFFLKITYSFIFNMGIKFIALIALLIFVRGGIPRYRYDFLTKIG